MTQRIQRHPYLAIFDGADPAASTPVPRDQHHAAPSPLPAQRPVRPRPGQAVRRSGSSAKATTIFHGSVRATGSPWAASPAPVRSNSVSSSPASVRETTSRRRSLGQTLRTGRLVRLRPSPVPTQRVCLPRLRNAGRDRALIRCASVGLNPPSSRRRAKRRQTSRPCARTELGLEAHRRSRRFPPGSRRSALHDVLGDVVRVEDFARLAVDAGRGPPRTCAGSGLMPPSL